MDATCVVQPGATGSFQTRPRPTRRRYRPRDQTVPSDSRSVTRPIRNLLPGDFTTVHGPPGPGGIRTRILPAQLDPPLLMEGLPVLVDLPPGEGIFKTVVGTDDPHTYSVSNRSSRPV